MKKVVLLCLVTGLMITACASPTPTSSATPTPSGLEPRPTPAVAYQIVGSTKYNAMVVVDPASNTDRAGLQKLGDYLCAEEQKCKVWFWDDIQKADTSFPVDPDKEQTLIAFYSFDFAAAEGVLKVYTLGDAR